MILIKTSACAVQKPHRAQNKVTEQVKAINHCSVRRGTDTDSLRLLSHSPHNGLQLYTHMKIFTFTHTQDHCPLGLNRKKVVYGSKGDVQGIVVFDLRWPYGRIVMYCRGRAFYIVMNTVGCGTR